MYLDDVTVGGTVEDVLRDLEVIREADVLGLTLNKMPSPRSFVRITRRGAGSSLHCQELWWWTHGRRACWDHLWGMLLA